MRYDLCNLWHLKLLISIFSLLLLAVLEFTIKICAAGKSRRALNFPNVFKRGGEFNENICSEFASICEVIENKAKKEKMWGSKTTVPEDMDLIQVSLIFNTKLQCLCHSVRFIAGRTRVNTESYI